MISVSEEPQFSAEDIYEIPTDVGRTSFEFDMNMIKACRTLFQMYPSNELLAKDLIGAQRIRTFILSLLKPTSPPGRQAVSAKPNTAGGMN